MSHDPQRPKAYNCAMYAIAQGARGPFEAWLGHGARADANMLDFAITTATSAGRDPDRHTIVRTVARRFLGESEAGVGTVRAQADALAGSGHVTLSNMLNEILDAHVRTSAEASIAGGQRTSIAAFMR